jgi:hypothetical protein
MQQKSGDLVYFEFTISIKLFHSSRTTTNCLNKLLVFYYDKVSANF